MIFKKFKILNSPSVFVFKDPDTGREFTGKSIAEMLPAIRGYRSQNELEELEYLPQVIENYLCSLPQHKGMCEPVKSPKRSVIQYLQGGVALLKNIAYASFCSQEEADRRSEICSRCPRNEFPNRTSHFTNWANDLANRSVGDRKSSHHNDLGVCGICSCPLRGKVHWAGKIKLTKENLEEMKKLDNPKCWQVPLAEVR